MPSPLTLPSGDVGTIDEKVNLDRFKKSFG